MSVLPYEPNPFSSEGQEYLELQEHCKTLQARIDQIDRVAACGTVNSFLQLTPGQKREWFAVAIEVASRLKAAEDRVEDLREILVQARSRLGAHNATCASYHSTSDDRVDHFEPKNCNCYLAAVSIPVRSDPSDQYYLQTRGYVGDSLLWWRQGRHGYTTNLQQAHIFTKEEAFAQAQVRPTEDFPWRKDYIDGRVEYHVSAESINGGCNGSK